MARASECAVCNGTGKTKKLKDSVASFLQSLDPDIRQGAIEELTDDDYDEVDCDNPFCDEGIVLTEDD